MSNILFIQIIIFRNKMIDIRKKEEFIWIIVSNESLFRDNTQFWYAWVLLNKRKKENINEIILSK